MSEAARFYALDQAVKVVGPGASSADVLSVATQFVAFLSPAATGAAQSAAGPEPDKAKDAKPATRAAKAAAAIKSAKGEDAKAAATLAADADADAETDAELGDTSAGPTEQDVKDAVSLALAGNKRAEVIALLKKYKAASASSVKEGDRAAFIAAAAALLPAEDDLAA